MAVCNSKPAAYLVYPKLYEALINCVEDLEYVQDMWIALDDFRKGKAVVAEEGLFG